MQKGVHKPEKLWYNKNNVRSHLIKAVMIMRLKKLVSFALSAVLLCGMAFAALPGVKAYELPEEMELNAAAAAVVFLGASEKDDVFLFEHNVDEVHAPAALVRLMAGAYALKTIRDKNLDMDTASGTYTLEMFNRYVAGTGVTAVGMEFGEAWTLRDLLTVSLIQTASDAVTTLAVTLSGSVEEFVKGMNDLAKEIGCERTHFANVTGLDSLSQYTTTRDIYRIFRYCMTFAEFEPMISTLQHKVQPLSGGQPYTIVNRVDMLRASSTFHYAPLKFGRTGLSEHEGWGLASVASDSGYDYMVIVMGCPAKNDKGHVGLHYTDSIDLYRWAFRNFTYKTLLTDNEILAGIKVKNVWGRDAVNLIPKEPFATVVYNDVQPDEVIKKITTFEDELTAPITAGTVYGKVELIVNVDEKIGEVELVAAESMNSNLLLVILSGIGAVLSSGWFWLVIGLLVLLLGGYIALLVLSARRHRRRVKSRRRR